MSTPVDRNPMSFLRTLVASLCVVQATMNAAQLPRLERRLLAGMTLDEARELVIDGIDYAAYKETGSSLHDSDKNRLFGSKHYRSGRAVTKPSPWAEGDFEEKMARLLAWATTLNFSDPAFGDAKTLLVCEDSVLGRVIRRTKSAG